MRRWGVRQKRPVREHQNINTRLRRSIYSFVNHYNGPYTYF